MAVPNEQPWSPAEKVLDFDDERCATLQLTSQPQNYMLAEIIKAHNPPPHVLLNVVANQLGIQQPNWNEIPMPPGQSIYRSAAVSRSRDMSRESSLDGLS